jgi:uncharacterized delta-60 repeat protein
VLAGGGTAVALKIQTDGKILVVARLTGATELIRYYPNGQLDPSFGAIGIVTNSDLSANAMAIQADGNILIVGTSTANAQVVLVRYNTDGSLDGTFGTGGKAVVAASPAASNPGSWNPRGLLVQADKRIVFNYISFEQGDVYRLNANGSPDAQQFSHAYPPLPQLNFPIFSAAALQPDGRLVVVGTLSPGDLPTPSVPDGIIVRYNLDGSIDTSFGAGGAVLEQVGFNGLTSIYDSAVYVQADGKIVVGEETFTGKSGIRIARYNSNGTLDTGFGGSGTGFTTGNLDAHFLYVSDGNLVAGPAGTVIAAPAFGYALNNPQLGLQLDLLRFTGGGVTVPSPVTAP